MGICVSPENSEEIDVWSRIQHIPMINEMNESQKVQIAQALQEKHFRAGEVLMQEGQEGHEFFLITKGHCEVFVKDSIGDYCKVSELGRGDYCGEQALISKSIKRTATVKATKATKCLVMEREEFQKVVRFAADNNELWFVSYEPRTVLWSA